MSGSAAVLARKPKRAGRASKPNRSGPNSRPRIDLAYARRVIEAEAKAVRSLAGSLDDSFRRAALWILGTSGRVVVTGMGKAGIVAQKVGATLASTGTPALFLHPAEALHGDLGMVMEPDVVLAFSNSGESSELLQLLPLLGKIGARVIAVTGRPRSTLGRAANLVLSIGEIEEPCPLRLAPSASTTAMLALGDALALCVLKARGFTSQDYARLHPGGALGRQLMLASDLMRSGERLAQVRRRATVGETLGRMTRARGGAAVVVDGRGRLAGIFTDGDFRRLMVKNPDLLRDPVGQHMTHPCRFILSTTLIGEAQRLMARMRINALPVVDRRGRVAGLLDIQDLVQF